MKALDPCLPGCEMSLSFVLPCSSLLYLTLFECSSPISFLSHTWKDRQTSFSGKLYTHTYQCVCSKCRQSHKSNPRSDFIVGCCCVLHMVETCIYWGRAFSQCITYRQAMMTIYVAFLPCLCHSRRQSWNNKACVNSQHSHKFQECF